VSFNCFSLNFQSILKDFLKNMPKETIIIAGGGLVGATAAAIFADRGHKVFFPEKSSYLIFEISTRVYSVINCNFS
jgi:ribulose 1,5-bisphosphate synthetase/thiazole synthase